MQFPDQFHYVFTEAVFICCRMIGIIQTSVNDIADRLKKNSEKSWVGFAYCKIPVCYRFYFLHIILLLSLIPKTLLYTLLKI